MRGRLILIEGLDRSGKSTQANVLAENFKNRKQKVELIKFPERSTPIGKLINSYLTDKNFNLSDQAAHLLFSANRWELATDITKKLEDGVNVILDRYYYSGIAYSCAKGMDFDWCASPDRGLLKPDLVIFLTLSMDTISQRSGFGDERYEVNEFQLKVLKKFEEFFFNKDEVFRPLNVDKKTIEQVKENIWSLLQSSGLTELTDDPIKHF